MAVWLACAPLIACGQSTAVAVVSPEEPAWCQSLNGRWKFNYIPRTEVGAAQAFFQPNYDTAAWDEITVPGHWELQGFAEPRYKQAAEGTGLYRRAFRLPAEWKSERIMLQFDGVLFGFEAWLNGQPIGSWESAFNPCTFDITNLVSRETENVLAVRVTTRSKGREFDSFDCWALSGIYRGVTLFAVPPVYLADYTAQTSLNSNGSADLRIECELGGTWSNEVNVTGRLLAPDGEVVDQFALITAANGRGAVVVRVRRPELWTAETPHLYRLELNVRSGGHIKQEIRARIGLRQITVDNGVLKLNGRPIKLRGVNRHELNPEVGRAVTEPQMRRDIALLKEANINFVRTSHYPPNRRFIEICDEEGIYVMCEVPFGMGDSHLSDPSYQDVLLTRARATVRRDKNRPSVIAWSLGNENPVTAIALETGREVKRLDPTRPICYPQAGSYFDGNWKLLPEFVDVYAPHYPVVDTLREYAKRLERPLIITEYAHSLGLAMDRVQEEWELMNASPRVAGGAIWMFQDQGLLRTSPMALDPLAQTPYVWIDPHHYYDTAGVDGVDGLVYSDRTPQLDYWEVRKVYSPIQVSLLESALVRGVNLHLKVENRYDFRSLRGVNLAWSVLENGVAIQSGGFELHAEPHQSEVVSLAPGFGKKDATSVLALALKFTDSLGGVLHERAFRLDSKPRLNRLDALLGDAARGELRLEETSARVRVVLADFEVELDRLSGNIRILEHGGRVLVAGIYPHSGRKFTMAEELRRKTTSIWPGTILRNGKVEFARATRTPNGVELRVRANYPRPDDPAQSLEGEHTLTISETGVIELAYAFSPRSAQGAFLEAGLSLVADSAASEFRWIGDGPYAGYPGKDRLNEFGIYHLNVDDIRFQGNRRNVEVAVVAEPSGLGFALVGAPTDVAVENSAAGIILSHNALVSGRGNKRTVPETSFDSTSVDLIHGKFALVMLKAQWPAALSAWLGAADKRAIIERPFYRSYDQ